MTESKNNQTDNVTDAQQLAEAAAAAMYARDPASRSFGITIESVAPGRASVQMTVREDMANGHKVCHGGIIFTLADTAMAFASNSYNQVALATKCSIDFLAPGHINDVLTATAEERAGGGRTALYDINVTNQDGKLIAVFRGSTTRIKASVTGSQAEE